MATVTTTVHLDVDDVLSGMTTPEREELWAELCGEFGGPIGDIANPVQDWLERLRRSDLDKDLSVTDVLQRILDEIGGN